MYICFPRCPGLLRPGAGGGGADAGLGRRGSHSLVGGALGATKLFPLAVAAAVAAIAAAAAAAVEGLAAILRDVAQQRRRTARRCRDLAIIREHGRRPWE